MEGWQDGRLEGWKVGRLEGWKVGKMLEWNGVVEEDYLLGWCGLTSLPALSRIDLPSHALF